MLACPSVQAVQTARQACPRRQRAADRPPPGQGLSRLCMAVNVRARCPLHSPTLCSASFHVVRESLKWRAKDAEAVDALHEAAPELLAIYRQLAGQPDGVPGAATGPLPCSKRRWHAVECGRSALTHAVHDSASPCNPLSTACPLPALPLKLLPLTVFSCSRGIVAALLQRPRSFECGWARSSVS
jgi:hypothetical protein